MDHWIRSDKAIEFNLDSLTVLRGPGVYMYCKGDLALYIGASKKVAGRILARNHHVTRLNEATSLLIFPCKDWETAKALESEMIGELRPELNMRNGRYYKANKIADRFGTTSHHIVNQYLTRKDA